VAAALAAVVEAAAGGNMQHIVNRGSIPKADVAIIGAGVIGLAVARELSYHSKKNIVVLEQNRTYGMETSSRNSEVIHAGIYHPANMLKTRFCTKGNHLLYEFCIKYKIGCQRLGKLIVASDDNDREQLHFLLNNARNNGVNLKPLTSSQTELLEPSITAREALFSRDTGILDTHALIERLYFLGKEKEVIYLFDSRVNSIEHTGNEYLVETKREKIRAEQVINTAGLYSSHIADLIGIDTSKYGYRLFPCKGEYYRLNSRFYIKHLVYPLPSQGVLGIHITPDLSGGLRLGPNAYYVSELDYNQDDRFKNDFYQSVHRFLPSLTPDDISLDSCGIRPRLQGPGDPVKDFIIREESDKGLPGFINLIGIESPGLTSSLAIAQYVNSLVK
jgi:L-2-hydroxyglutarate oxidase LhgO